MLLVLSAWTRQCWCRLQGISSIQVNHQREHLVGCTNRECVYEGMCGTISYNQSFIMLLHLAVCMEQAYSMLCQPTQLFCQEQNRPQDLCCYMSWNNSSPEQDLNFMADVRRIERQAPVSESPFLKLIWLDFLSHPGLPKSEFFYLFAMCQQCHWVMT